MPRGPTPTLTPTLTLTLTLRKHRFGGFGSDHCSGNTLESWRDREELVRIAAARARSSAAGAALRTKFTNGRACVMFGTRTLWTCACLLRIVRFLDSWGAQMLAYIS